jgi:hypothetical protein
MSRRITLRNEDHEWMVGIVEGMIRKANKEASIWVDHMPQLERIKDALYTAAPGFEELFPDDPPDPVKLAVPKFRAPKPRVDPVQEQRIVEKVAAATPKPRAKRGERLANLPNLCPKHPAYAAVRRPKTLDCEGCWAAFKRNRSPGEYEKARAAAEQKG